MNIGDNIRKIRRDKDISQEQLAKAVGVSQPMIAQIERGSRTATMPIGKAIADVLGCDVTELYKCN